MVLYEWVILSMQLKEVEQPALQKIRTVDCLVVMLVQGQTQNVHSPVFLELYIL